MTDRTDLVAHVAAALSEAECRPPDDLGYSLHDHVDTELLVALADCTCTDWTFTFEVDRHDVRVTSDGDVFVDNVLWRTDALAGPRG